MANLFRCAGAGGEDIKCIERPYNSNDIYNTGDTAMYNGLLRICTADGVTGEFDVSKWEVTTLDELLGENIGENDALVDYIASEYDPTHTYAAGDAILGDNGEILKCLEDDVTGEFDNSKWSRDYLCNLSGNVNSNLGAKLLWTNSNVSAGWAQNASISVNISKYKYIVLELLTTSTGTPFYIFADTKNWYGNVCAATVISNVTYQRWIVTLTTNTITLGSGAPNNMYAIPYKVYGFNGTLE